MYAKATWFAGRGEKPSEMVKIMTQVRFLLMASFAKAVANSVHVLSAGKVFEGLVIDVRTS